MSIKNVFLKSTALAVTCGVFAVNATANWQFSAGIGYGMGLFKFNDKKDVSTFQGNLALPGNQAPVAMRTSYKYIGNLPQRLLHLEVSAIKRFEGIRLMDRNFFLGATFGFGWGKANPAYGLLNPKAQYLKTGTTGLFWSLNAKFGFENAGSKIYGLLGGSLAKTDLPFDILPLGYYTNSPDIITCVAAKPGGDLANSLVNLPGTTIFGQTPAAVINSINNSCNNIKVKNANYTTFFVNLGAGLEVNVTKRITLFAEYLHMFQLNKGKIHSVNYLIGNNAGVFKGKIKTTNVDYIKAGFRFYFN